MGETKNRFSNGKGHRQFERQNDLNRRQRESDKWAGIWHGKLCRFHDVPVKTDWNYSADQVIQFLKDRVKRNEPAWKRQKISFPAPC
jgi:hypothetical protein